MGSKGGGDAARSRTSKFSRSSRLAFGAGTDVGGGGTGAALGSLTLLGAPFGLPLDFGVSGSGAAAGGSCSGVGAAPTSSQTTSIFLYLQYYYIGRAIF